MSKLEELIINKGIQFDGEQYHEFIIKLKKYGKIQVMNAYEEGFKQACELILKEAKKIPYVVDEDVLEIIIKELTDE